MLGTTKNVHAVYYNIGTCDIMLYYNVFTNNIIIIKTNHINKHIYKRNQPNFRLTVLKPYNTFQTTKKTTNLIWNEYEKHNKLYFPELMVNNW